MNTNITHHIFLENKMFEILDKQTVSMIKYYHFLKHLYENYSLLYFKLDLNHWRAINCGSRV
jgi:hypothetical protein